MELIKVLRGMLDAKYPHERKLLTSAVSANVFRNHDRKPLEQLDTAWSRDMDAFYIMVIKLVSLKLLVANDISQK